MQSFESKGFKKQALAVTNDPEHKFDLALQLGDLRVAYQIAKETEVVKIKLFCLQMKSNVDLMCAERTKMETSFGSSDEKMPI